MAKQIDYEGFINFLSERYGESPEIIKSSENFGELGLDSLTLFSLLTDIEKEYDLKLDVEDLTEINTVEKMYQYLIQCKKGE